MRASPKKSSGTFRRFRNPRQERCHFSDTAFTRTNNRKSGDAACKS
jgi:hypothetical protein